MTRARILVIEDEPDILELVTYNLAREHYRPTGVASGEEGLKSAAADPPALILLDLMLPGVSGLEVCRRLRRGEKTKDIPIIMITAKGEESDIVTGLEMGADDYITKPFSPRVLMARVQAILRRAAAESGASEVVSVHDCTIHPGRHEVTVGGSPVDLTATEFRVLSALARRPGWVLTRQQIVEEVHGAGYAVTDRAVDVQIVSLRKKLGAAGEYIETVRGIGYRMRD